jgi:hypothetical protein
MTVSAVQHLQKMRGGSQSHLMRCDDDNFYVVKFQNNPQGIKVLANELLATRLADIVGLSVPACEIVEVNEWLIAGTPELRMHLARTSEPCQAGLQFGSRFTGGMIPGLMLDYLDDEALFQVKNIKEFAGMLVFDKWTGNADGRQAIFLKRLGQARFKATFIDQGYCFNLDWRFSDAPLRGIYNRRLIYKSVVGWESFQPWLERVESFDPGQLRAIGDSIPPEWYNRDTVALDRLVQAMAERRGKVRALIVSCATASSERFPQWLGPNTSLGGTAGLRD